MNLNHICLKCMKEKPDFGVPCPYCGFDESEYPKEKIQLNYFSVLRGQYLVGKTIGQGGFGITYIGFDMNLEMKVAIKEYFPDGFANRNHELSDQIYLNSSEHAEELENEKKNFIEEARILAQLDELPGIVKVRDYFQENNTAYIVMEYVEGETLRDYLKRNGGRIPASQLFNLMEPVLKSLIRIHEKGIIHRDISPDNIMLTSQNRIKLIDFGAADRGNDLENKLTLVYKEYFSPIEQRLGKGEVGTYSDIYALCATIYSAITGQLPDSVVEREENDLLMNPSEFGIEISAVQQAALMKGLSLYPEDRFEDAKDLYYFLYVYGQNNDRKDRLSREIENQKTKELIAKIESRSKQRNYKKALEISIGIATLLFLAYFLLRDYAVSRKSISTTPQTAVEESQITEESNENYQSSKENSFISLEDAEEDFYQEMLSRHQNYFGSELKENEILKQAVEDFGNTLKKTDASKLNGDFNALYQNILNEVSGKYDLAGCNWMIIPVTEIKDATAILDMGLENEVNEKSFETAKEIAVSLTETDLGYYFYIVFMK